MTKKYHLTPRDPRINILSEIVSYKYDELFSNLGVRLSKFGKALRGTCAVHGGDCPTSLTYYPDGHTIRGFWKCHSHHCEKLFVPTVIGLTRGVLSNQQYGWRQQGDKVATLYETIDYLCKFVGQDFASIKVNRAEEDKKRFISQIATLGFTPQVREKGWTRQEVRSRINTDCDYYRVRGYLRETLEKYDVGLAATTDPANPFFERIIVPVYDDAYTRAIGFTARSIHPRCEKCDLYHLPGSICPVSNDARLRASKWWNNKGFAKERYLYNYWFARKHIRESQTVVLVESPGNVWRLEEAGIHNAVGIFGSELTDSQQILLESSGAMKVVIVPDSDAAGTDGAKKIEALLARSFRVKVLYIDSGDVGDMSVQEVKTKILPGII